MHRTGAWPHTRRRYDVIVSGLPLQDLAPLQVERTMARYMELLHPGGTLTHACRPGTRMLQTLFAPKAQGRRTAVGKIMAAYQGSYGSGRRIVWSHLPPDRVWYLQRPLEAPDERASRDGAMP